MSTFLLWNRSMVDVYWCQNEQQSISDAGNSHSVCCNFYTGITIAVRAHCWDWSVLQTCTNSTWLGCCWNLLTYEFAVLNTSICSIQFHILDNDAFCLLSIQYQHIMFVCPGLKGARHRVLKKFKYLKLKPPVNCLLKNWIHFLCYTQTHFHHKKNTQK